MLLIAVTVLAATALVACTGDGDTDDDEASSDASTAAFADAHEVAVDRYADALEEVQRTGLDAVVADPVGAHEVYDGLREVTADAHAALAALTAPADVAEQHERLVALLDEQVAALEAAVRASQARDDRELETHLDTYAGLLADWRQELGVLTDRLPGS